MSDSEIVMFAVAWCVVYAMAWVGVRLVMEAKRDDR